MIKQIIIYLLVVYFFTSCGADGSVESNICCLSAGDKSLVNRGDVLIPDGDAEILVTHCQDTGERTVEIIDGSARLLREFD